MTKYFMQSFPFSYEHAKTINYSNAGKSDFYVNGDVALIIDSCICNKTQNELLDYSLITNMQNCVRKMRNKSKTNAF